LVKIERQFDGVRSSPDVGEMPCSTGPLEQGATMASYKILLDTPCERPAFDFDQYADAFSKIILQSDPRFAIGIFGRWGSGKTTLMQAIRREVCKDPRVVPVDFNAWRYEREENLIVPLLDMLRDELVRWADERAPDRSLKERALEAAAKVKKASRAVLAGVTLKAKGAVFAGPEASLDLGKVLDRLDAQAEGEERKTESFYHACFAKLREATKGFAGANTQRIVVFIDDLDRCMPETALQVLESMKLFFDVDGFIFVVGLDDAVIRQLVNARYRSGTADGDALISGSEYLKKIFQVPFTLPQITPERLGSLLTAERLGDLPAEQLQEVQDRLGPHLGVVVAESGVNPREVRRYINAYTLQRMTNPKLAEEAVLGFQTILFRADWEQVWTALLTFGDAFLFPFRQDVRGARRALRDLWPQLEADIPESFFNFMESEVAKPLRDVASVGPFLYSAEATQTTPVALLEAYGLVGSVRAHILETDQRDRSAREIAADVRKDLRYLRTTLSTLPGSLVVRRAVDDVSEALDRAE
jgi:hypothetical protein